MSAWTDLDAGDEVFKLVVLDEEGEVGGFFCRGVRRLDRRARHLGWRSGYYRHSSCFIEKQTSLTFSQTRCDGESGRRAR